MLGNLFMLFIVLFLIHDVVPISMSLLYSLTLISIVAIRSYFIRQYFQVEAAIGSQEDLDYWLRIYKVGVFLTGFIWGAIYFILPDLPTEYNFIIFAILVGNTSVGLLSMGIVSSVFYAYMFPMLCTVSLWMFLKGEDIYTAAGFVAVFGMLYYSLFTRKYARDFSQALLDKENIKENVSQLETSQEENIKLKERTELALKGSSTSVLDWDYLKNESYISPSWKEMLGFSDTSAANEFMTWKHRVHKEDLRKALHEIKQAMSKQEPYLEITHRLRHENGHYLWVLAKAQIFYDANGKAIRMIGTHRDITKEREIELKNERQKEKLDYQAHHDELTGLPNRTLFNDRLTKGIQKAKRQEKKMALLFIDLDHFKEINDTLGHDIGDIVLQKVTEILRSVVREEDSISRLGGDEFTILIEDLNKGEDASILAQKIIKVLDNPINVDNRELRVSSSIGISLYPDDGASALNLLKYADSAMYKAKAEGRNNFQFYCAEMTLLAFERLAMETNLREAIKNEEFIVLYQAQVNAQSDNIVGMEALVRWNHPTMGIIAPAKFLALAESTGLMVEIDKYVMKTAMKQLNVWREKALNPGKLSLNLTIKQLEQKEFVNQFKELMKETECRAEWIELEVTEGHIMKNPEEAIKVLRAISEIGISLAVDDFGTGYSSLSYLKKLPIDKLKIDQSFVRELPDDEEDRAIVRAVIALAQSLNLQIIAEGVETREQKEFMLENGCQYIQGYFYSKPINDKEFEALLIKGF